MKQYKKLAINTFLFTLGNIGSRSISFLMLPIFTRYMIPEDYGKLDVINTTVSLLVPILSLQIIEAIFRFAVESRVDHKNRDLLSTATLFSLIAFALSLFVHPILMRIAVFSQYSTYFYVIFYLTILNGLLKQYIRGLEKIKLYVFSDILYSLVFAVSNVILLVVLKLGMKAYLVSNIVALSCASLLIILVASLYKQIRLKIDKSLLKEMLAYSVPLIPNGIMWWIVTASDRYIVTYFLGYESTGIYSVAARFPSLLTVLYGIFFQAWQLSAMEEYGKEDYGIFFGKVFGVISSVMFLSSSLLFVIIKPFMGVFVGKAYSESWKYVPFLFLGAVFNTFASFYGVNYTASKKTIGAFSTSVIAAGVKIVSILALIKLLGLQAASISSLLAYSSMWLARIYHTKKLAQTKVDRNRLILSSVLLMAQALILLLVKKSIIMYTLQGITLVILLLLQWKYLWQILRFGRALFQERVERV